MKPLDGLKLLAVAFLCFVALHISCSHQETNSLIPWQSIVDSFSSLTQDLDLADVMRENEGPANGWRFPVLRFFSVLDHLTLEREWTLDYVYMKDGLSGFPILYVRKWEESPFRDMKEFAEKRGRPTRDEYWARMYGKSSPELNNSLYGYMDRVKIDDTPLGYFQFVVLRLMGNQFYLFWHAGYHDEKIICDYAGLEAMLVDLAKGGWGDESLPASILNKAAHLDFEPTIEFNEQSVTVKVVVFTKWGGFIRKSFQISRRFPHKVSKEKEAVLLAYDCGMSF